MDKIDKLWELMRDVDSLEDIYETSEGYYAFVFESPGNIDKRVEQIMNGLDKEGYMNSFEKTFSSEIIIFDIDFEDELEEGIDYKPKFISNKSIEELQNELNQMYADQYKYGRSIDRPRMWDINYTIKQLENGLEEDWRDGTFTKDDFNKYASKMKSEAYRISNSIQYMIDKHPEYADLFDNLVSEIIDILNRTYINESVSNKSINESRNTAWDSSRVVDLVSYYLTKFDNMPINQLQKKIWITMKEEGSKLPDVETFKKTVIETVDNFNDELDELGESKSINEELKNIDGWSDTIVDKCEPFFSKAEQVMYGVRNTVRGSYGLGDTVEDLAQVFEELASDAEELAEELRASDDAGELTEDFDINSLSDKEKYMFLDRMKQDCKYFLGNGNRHTKYLFGNSVKEHIESMKELYNSLKEKPEWLSMEDIEEFEKKMTETL